MGSTGKNTMGSGSNSRRVPYIVGNLTEDDIAEWVKSTNTDMPMSTDDTTLNAIIGSQDVSISDIDEDTKSKIKAIIINNRLNGVIGDKWYRNNNITGSQIIYSVKQDGNNYYLVTDMSNSTTQTKISYAKTPEKAYASNKYVGKLMINDVPQLETLLKMKLGK